MRSSVKPHPPSAEYYFEEGCFITELSNNEDDADVSIAQARVPPGDTTRWHKLINTIERYVILAGTGIVEVGKLPATEVNPGDTVIIAAGDRQRIHNHGKTDLIFLAICSPRFRSENYIDIELQ